MLRPDARRATPGDRDMVVAALTRAFSMDPLVRWFFPDDVTYTVRATAFFGYLFDIRIEHGEVQVAGDGDAASLWTPPGGVTMSQTEQDRRWIDGVEAGAGSGELRRLETYEDAVQAMTPDQPHWYLGVLGTDPAHRGLGLARAVIEPVLERADLDGFPAFLETATPANLPFYARFGFEELAHADLPDGPTVRALWRSAGDSG